MNTKQKRWKCPQCGTGALAPSRPRKNDVRRYCLECSHKTGYLVERVAPTLQAKRAVAKVKTAERAKKRIAKSREKYLVAGFDAEKYLRKLATLPVYGGRKGTPYQLLKQNKLDLVVHRSKQGFRTYLGRCHGSPTAWRATIELYTHANWNETTLREVLLHELMHLEVANKNGRHHPKEFHRKMKVAWRQAERKLGPPDTKRPTYVFGKWAKKAGIVDPQARFTYEQHVVDDELPSAADGA